MLLTEKGRHIEFSGVNTGQILILTSEIESLPPKTVYNMYYTMIKVTKCQNQNFTRSRGMAIFDDPQNDLNDLEKIQP